MEKSKEWKICIKYIEEFFYGDKGIYETAQYDENLETYTLDMDEVLMILNQIKQVEKNQGKLLQEQIKELEEYKKNFLEIDNGKNRVEEKYEIIKSMYENIEEYQ